MNFDLMNYVELVIYCYDYRPDVYRCLTAETTEVELRRWLGGAPPSPMVIQQQIINQAETITIEKQVVINNPTGPISF